MMFIELLLHRLFTRTPKRLFDQFTYQAKQTLRFAANEASACNHPTISAVHFLLGLLHDTTSGAGRLLQGAGLDLQQAQAAVHQVAGSVHSFPFAQPELDQRSKDITAQAVLTARRFKDDHIGTAHILFSVLMQHDATVNNLFVLTGVSQEQLRERLTTLLGSGKLFDTC